MRFEPPADGGRHIDALDGTRAFNCLEYGAFAERAGALSKHVVAAHGPTGLYRRGRIDRHSRVSTEKRVVSIDGGWYPGRCESCLKTREQPPKRN